MRQANEPPRDYADLWATARHMAACCDGADKADSEAWWYWDILLASARDWALERIDEEVAALPAPPVDAAAREAARAALCALRARIERLGGG